MRALVGDGALQRPRESARGEARHHPGKDASHRVPARGAEQQKQKTHSGQGKKADFANAIYYSPAPVARGPATSIRNRSRTSQATTPPAEAM